MKKLLVLLLIATQAWAGLPPTSIQGQNDTTAKTKFAFQVPNNQFTDLGGVKALVETGNDNLLKNPNFQATGLTTSAVPSWTLAGTGVAVTLPSTVSYQNDSTLELTLTAASGNLLYQDVTVSNVSGVAAENSFYIYNSGNVGSLQVCPRLNGVTLTGGSNCVNVPNGGSWFPVAASTVGGSGTTSIGVSLYATASTSGSVWVTHAYVGKNRNIGTVQQMVEVGSITISGCTGNFQYPTTTGAFDDVTQTGCTYTATGQLSAPSTMYPGFHATFGAPGDYIVVPGLSFTSNSSGSGYVRMSNGTINSRESPQYANPTTGGMGWFGPGQFTFSVTSSQLAADYRLQEQHVSGNALTLSSTNSTYPATTTFTVYYVPSQSSAVASLATAAQSWSGYQSGITAGCSTTSNTYADPSACTGVALTMAASQNVTCTQSGTGPAISCVFARTGMTDISADVGVTAASGAAPAAARLVDSSGYIIDPGKTVFIPSGGAGLQAIVHLQGQYNVTNTTTVFKVQLANQSGAVAASVASNASLTTGSGQVMWNIGPRSNGLPQPYTTGNVSSTSAGMEHMERAMIGASAGTLTSPGVCASGSCAVISQSGTWASAVTWNSTGQFTITPQSGEFSQMPTCTCSSGDYGTVTDACSFAPRLSTASSLVFVTASGATAANDSVSIVCMGPH